MYECFTVYEVFIHQASVQIKKTKWSYRILHTYCHYDYTLLKQLKGAKVIKSIYLVLYTI